MDCCATGNTRVIKIEFGKVQAGMTVVKTLKIVNESQQEQTYEARRDPITNPLDYVFNLHAYSWSLPPGGTFECDICYKPLTPFYKNIDYFSITDCTQVYYKIIVHGTCIGPNVYCSVSKMILTNPKKGDWAKKRMLLTNNSKVSAYFMFDIDLTQCPFKLDIVNGVLKPNAHVYITLTFCPPDLGHYAFHLPCLIQNQSPIIIELYGYNGTSFQNQEQFHSKMFPRPLYKAKGFEGYMSDSVIIRDENTPPISLSYNYIDFGQTNVGGKNASQRIPRTICLTNHSQLDIFMKWDEDVDGSFCIKPTTAQVQQRQSTLFEVHFDPSVERDVFYKELLGRIFWGPMTSWTCQNLLTPSLTVPLVITIRLIGHSFPSDSDIWIPQYDVPRTVIMPPCVPPISVYTTFMIKRRGYVPLMFRFIPPATSHFIVKPMIGVIRNDYQIVTLGMFPEEEGQPLYIERWAIQFNGNCQYEVPIDFRGFTESPSVIFNNNDLVAFQPVHPGCYQSQELTMRNVTRHCILYSFNDVPEELNLQSIEGRIHPNEILTHNWIFCPLKLRDYTFKIDCCLTSLIGRRAIGTLVNVPINVTGKSEPGILVAIPNEINFGIVGYGTTKTLSFNVFNFSGVEIHFQMSCQHRGIPVGDVQNDIHIHPTSGTVRQGKKERLYVSITPHEPGFYELSIIYFIRPNAVTDSIVSNVEPINVCKVNCMCLLPTLQIKDLLYYGTGPNTSKVRLWNMLKVNKLNSFLETSKPGQKEIFNVHFPELVLNDEPLLIKLLIINPTPIIASWILKRIQICSCPRVPKKGGSMTFKSTEFNCQHREACTIYPKERSLQKNETAVLTIEVKYKLQGLTTLQWDLEFGQDRHVIWNAEIVGLSEHECGPTLFDSPRIILNNIYIGDMNPVYQLCWMYNDMDHDVSYTLDTSQIHKVNEAFTTNVFSCEESHGIMKARSTKSLIFKFHPRQFGKFEVVVPMKLGNKQTDLLLKGEGISFDISKPTKEVSPVLDTFCVPEVPVYFNTDHISIMPVPTHSKVTRMIMIRNTLKNDVIGYKWQNYSLPNLLRINIQPTTGRIQPDSVQTFRLTVHTGGLPFKGNADITCEFMNLSKKRLYQKSLIMQDILHKELEGQFVITEKGLSVPNAPMNEVKNPKPFYKGLTIRCGTYSLPDENLKVSIDDQLKNTPPNEFSIPSVLPKLHASEEVLDMSTFILEGLIWDILYSDDFKRVMKENLIPPKDMLYSQFVMDPSERKRLSERSYITPPKRLLESLLEEVSTN